MSAPCTPAAGWRTSSFSNGNQNCVEVNTGSPAVIGVRDSKDRSGPVLSFDAAQWSAFTTAVRAGTFG